MHDKGLKPVTDFATFTALDIRIGTVVEAMPFPEARNPSYLLLINFGGEIGIKRSSAQITKVYSCDDLVGSQIVAIVNFPAKRIASFESEVLVLGVGNSQGDVVLLQPERCVPDGTAVY